MSARRLLVVGGAVVLGLVAAVVLTRDGNGPSDASAGTPTSAPRLVRIGPASPAERNGGRVGFARTEGGATEAAMSYASAPQRWMYLDDEGVTRAVNAIATSSAAPRLT